MEATIGVGTGIVPPKFSKRKKWLYGGIAAVIVLGAGAVVYARTTQSAVQLSPDDIYHVNYGNVSQSISTSGTIQAATEIGLNFQGTSGVLTQVDVKVGSHVKAGQILARMDDTTAREGVVETQANVANAEANLMGAEAKLTQTQEGSTSATIAQDQMNITKAQTTLAAAKQAYQDELAIVNDPVSSDQQLVSAENQVAQAQASLTAAEQANTGNQQTSNAQIQEDETNLANAQQTLAKDQAQYGNITEAQVEQAFQTYQTELSHDEAWNQGDFTGTNPYDTPMNNADAEYTYLNNGYTTLQNDETAVANDQIQLQKDQATLQNSSSSVATAQANYNAAVKNLQEVQAAVNDKTQSKQTLDNAESQVTQDEVNLQSAELQLKLDEEPPDAATLQAAEATVATAQAGVTTAEAQLQDAETTENETILRAPISGVVTQVNGSVGEIPSAASSSSSSTGTTGFIVLDDSTKSDLQVNLQVSQSQIGAVHAGEPIQVTVDAYPNQTFSGTIIQVYPTPQVVSNVTEYTVLASVNNRSGLLKSGMTANVNVQTASKNHVLIVPAISVAQIGNIEGVFVIGQKPSSSSQTTSFTKSGKGNSASHSYTSKKNSSSSSTGFGGFSRGTGFIPKNMKLPPGVYFQPVQIGMFGTGTEEITSGLTAGEEIMRIPPGQATTSSSTNAQGGKGNFGGGGFAGGGLGAVARGSFGGGKG